MNPDDMSGETRVPGRYPEWTKTQLLLLLLWNKLQEAYDEGDSELRVIIARGGPEAQFQVGYPPVNVSYEVPELSRVGEAISVFDRLRKEGYVHIDFGRSGPNVDVATPVLYGLSSKGLVDIGKLPDPDEKLARAFEEAARLLEQEQSIPPEEKRDMLETISKVVALLNNVQGLGTAVAQGLGPPPGG